jgi:hypothetical protein
MSTLASEKSNVVQFPIHFEVESKQGLFDREEDVREALDYLLEKEVEEIAGPVSQPESFLNREMSTVEIYMATKDRVKSLRSSLDRLKYYLDELESVELFQK